MVPHQLEHQPCNDVVMRPEHTRAGCTNKNNMGQEVLTSNTFFATNGMIYFTILSTRFHNTEDFNLP